MGTDGDGLVLGFAYEFHRGRIEDVKNRIVVEETNFPAAEGGGSVGHGGHS